MTYTFTKYKEFALLTIDGSLIGQYQLNEITTDLTNWLVEDYTYFIVDLSKLTTINSTGLAILLTILTKSRNAGGDTVLSNIPKQLQKLLIITKLNAIFTVTESVEAAAESLLETQD